jgi:F-box and WD-40 domain protein 1/11
MSIIDQLPTSEVCEIVRRLRPRLYINFLQYLPPEVCLKILGFLDPISLINTARASKEWMLMALDRKLWEQVYHLEGFRVVRSEIQKFELSINADHSIMTTMDEEQQSSMIEATSQQGNTSLQADGDSDMADAETPISQHPSVFGPSTRGNAPRDTDEDMIDISKLSPQTSKLAQWPSQLPHSRPQFQNGTSQPSLTSGVSRSPMSSLSSLVVLDRSDDKKRLNWQYLYSQRRRLEENWETEKYTNFQLPHPNHPEEAHHECIYTIQHSGNFLVSGSRDRTLRIWNLDTRRLIREPLVGHTGSVLCLQFDADPEENLIVSGSSDSTIILWEFSTGKLIQRIRKAHRESVLNVRFDKRVLVSCSKDKTIKIFNRKPLSPGDMGYSGNYMQVDPVPTYLNNYGFNPAPTAGLPSKPAYSMISVLEGHGAAVNAVQIHGNEVVSASGDRTVKVWDWSRQTCLRTLIGHTKGIACVQYDGRRIVSGSSDNEVKVFDRESALEVATLKAHTNLVRTVQAGFGDLPYSEEEDKKDAKTTDMAYFQAIEKGEIAKGGMARGRPRNAGSRKPEDITAYGAKLPPGGGGGKFGRIVSGSYDETIIIWRRDKEGVWRAQHTLRQEEAARSASRFLRRTTQTNAINQLEQPAPAQAESPSSNTATNPTPATNSSSLVAFYRQLIDSAILNGPAALHHLIRSHPNIIKMQYFGEAISALPPATQQTMNLVAAGASQNQQPNAGQNTSGDSGTFASGSSTQSGQPSQSTHTPTQTQGSPTTPTTSAATPVAPTSDLQGPAVQSPATTTNITTPAQATPPAAPAPHHPQHHHLTTNMARVFKLQFDARRIICCSQTSVIVGWDFANGDEQIIEASRFFAPIE